MRQRSFHIGPGAASLILILLTLSLSALGVLALLTARSDSRLASRSLEVAAEIAELNIQAEQRYAEIDALLCKVRQVADDDEAYTEGIALFLPEDMTFEDGLICWTESMGSEETNQLVCALRVLPMAENRRTEWVEHRYAAPESGEEEFF